MIDAAALDGCRWPLPRLHEGVERLCRSAGVRHTGVTPAEPVPASTALDPHQLGRALDRIAAEFGLEFEPVPVRYRDAEWLAGRQVVRLTCDSAGKPGDWYLILGRAMRSRVRVLRTDGTWIEVRQGDIASALRAPLVMAEAGGIDAVLDRAVVNVRRRGRARAALLATLLDDRDVADAWLMRPDPGGAFTTQLRHARVPRDVAVLLSLHAAQMALWVLAWAVIGRTILDGRGWDGWFTAWVLLLLTIVPLQTYSAWLQGSVALRAGRLLKERLLTGALRLEPDEVRHDGAGRHLGRVIESDAVETLALSGGLQAGLAAVELLVAGSVLSTGVTPTLLVGLLVLLTALAAVGAAFYHASRRRWTTWRLAMTHDFVERLTGHRTRLAQEVSDRWHIDEDHALDEYAVRSASLDRVASLLQSLTPRLWTAAAVAALAPAFIAGAAPTALAVTVGGVLLAASSLRRFADALSHVSGATAAWDEAKPLFAAAIRGPLVSAVSEAPSRRRAGQPRPPSLEVRDVSYRYPTRPQPALVDCALQAAEGDRLLLQGSSGGGKSTLAAMIAGLRTPDAGLILVQGLDRRTLGDHAWRRRTVAVPQFHENHVFAETFAFNLLMGRRWPPRESDLTAAEEIAAELGLSRLLSRMPAGLQQVVGESGWQLSHGERSRLFMARALLQGSDVLILDESFAALDPETLRQCLHCVLKRAPTLLVVAHP